MKFLADENIPVPVVRALRKHGFDIAHILELVSGLSDEALLERARRSGALLITEDKDFGEMVFKRRLVTAGVILVRLPGLRSTLKAKIVVAAHDSYSDRLQGNFAVITRRRVRIRRRE